MEESGRELVPKRLLREKAPELALEAASVVFAVLVALAVDEWRDNRANAQLATRARASIIEEIRANRADLSESREDNQAILASIDQALSKIDTDETVQVNVDFSVSLLSSSAWETAQMTRSVHFLEYEWLAKISTLYELQEFYEDLQSELVSYFTGVDGDCTDGEPEILLRGLRRHVETVSRIHDNLLDEYTEILGESGSASIAVEE
ncbi:MAG: hypothetical protein GY856_33260 [bacterium]|nr:hypothetical protein [bacterium]